jgi:hypothetical protein
VGSTGGGPGSPAGEGEIGEVHWNEEPVGVRCSSSLCFCRSLEVTSKKYGLSWMPRSWVPPWRSLQEATTISRWLHEAASPA